MKSGIETYILRNMVKPRMLGELIEYYAFQSSFLRTAARDTKVANIYTTSGLTIPDVDQLLFTLREFRVHMRQAKYIYKMLSNPAKYMRTKKVLSDSLRYVGSKPGRALTSAEDLIRFLKQTASDRFDYFYNRPADNPIMALASIVLGIEYLGIKSTYNVVSANDLGFSCMYVTGDYRMFRLYLRVTHGIGISLVDLYTPSMVQAFLLNVKANYNWGI